MKRYVIGFYFTPAGTVLIHKAEGRFKGTVNGLGGKIEAGETIEEAMVREFWKECGCLTEPLSWQQVVTVTGSDYELNALRGFGVLRDTPTTTSDEGAIALYAEPPPHMEITARWLWHLCNDHSLSTVEIHGVVRDYGGI